VSSLIGSLGDVADFINGAAFKLEDWGDDGARIIRIQNLTDATKPYNRTTRVVTERIHVQPGDLLVSWSATLGVFEWGGPDVAYLNQHIFRVVPDERKVDKRYLRHALELALLDMRKHLHGATMLHVNRGEFLSTKLYLPSLPEQRRIAAILDKAHALHTKRREALAQLDGLARSIFAAMFASELRRKESIGELIERGMLLYHKDGNHGSQYPRADEFGEEGVAFLSARCINEFGQIDGSLIERLNDRKANQLKIGWIDSGDVLLSHNASVGKVATYSGQFGRALIGTSLTAYRPNPEFLMSAFLAEALKAPDFQLQLQKNMGQTTRNQVPITAQRDLLLPLPPINQQLEFVRRIACVEQQRRLHVQALNEAVALQSSLQRDAFQGSL
jgi:type I restriction enzyme, S subunit